MAHPSLKLIAIHCQTGKEESRIIDRLPLEIGRAKEIDRWTLSDSARRVSKQHCRFECRDDCYFVIDNSANGTFLNGRRLPPGKPVQLHDGDTLTLCNNPPVYELRVSIGPLPVQEPKRRQEPESPAPEPVAPTWWQAEGEVDRKKRKPPELPPLPQPWAGAGGLSPEADLETRKPSESAPPPERPWWETASPLPELALQPPRAAEVPPPPESPWGEMNEPSPVPIAKSSQELETLLPAEQPTTPDKILPSPQRVSGTTDKAVLAAFYQGAGLPDLPIAEADIPGLLHTLGQIFRQTVQGLYELLQARSTVKVGFRIPQHTMIGSIKLNPIKFMSPEMASEQLLTQKNPVCLPAVGAVKEVFVDLKAHELAIMAGIQAALKHLLTRFEPRNLELHISNRSFLDNILPANRKAKYWEEFIRLYTEIAGEAQDDFQKLFEGEFEHAYQQQVDQLLRNTGEEL